MNPRQNPLKPAPVELDNQVQHDIPVICRVRADDQPLGVGTTLLFKGTDDETAINRLAIWLVIVSDK